MPKLWKEVHIGGCILSDHNHPFWCVTIHGAVVTSMGHIEEIHRRSFTLAGDPLRDSMVFISHVGNPRSTILPGIYGSSVRDQLEVDPARARRRQGGHHELVNVVMMCSRLACSRRTRQLPVAAIGEVQKLETGASEQETGDREPGIAYERGENSNIIGQ